MGPVCMRRRGRLAALAALAALAVLAARWPPRAPRAVRVQFPHARASAVAHLLADFSTHPLAARPWQVHEERGNYSAWSYRVTFECGARCAGEAHVHAAPAAVRMRLAACSHLPLLPWPSSCDEAEVEWRVQDAGAGCVLQESAREWCGALRTLSGACARDAARSRRDHVERLRARLRPDPAGRGL